MQFGENNFLKASAYQWVIYSTCEMISQDGKYLNTNHGYPQWKFIGEIVR